MIEKAMRVNQTSFAKFIREASAVERSRVYMRVLQRASNRQQALMQKTQDK